MRFWKNWTYVEREAQSEAANWKTAVTSYQHGAHRIGQWLKSIRISPSLDAKLFWLIGRANPVITSGIQAPKNAHNEIEYKIEINKYFYKVDFKWKNYL